MKEKPLVTDLEREVKALRAEVAYLRGMAERTVGKLLQLDTDTITIRHELEQKRRGFKLMSELASPLVRHGDLDSLFVSVSRRLNAALGMQRTAVLMPEPSGGFRPVVLHGYPPDAESRIAMQQLRLPPEFLDAGKPVLITGADPADLFAPLREALNLPYLVSSPVFLRREVVAVLITGRVLEQPPYLPRLGRSDVETMQTVSSHLATLLAGQRLVEAEQRTQIMVDAMPLCCNFWDENHNNIDCNQEAVRLFDLFNKAEYLEKFHQLSPESQPDGRLSAEAATEKVREAFASGYARFEWLHQKLNGEPIPAEITLVRVKRAKGFIVVGYTRDLREHKAMLAAIQKNQDELRLARDMAEKNARVKSEFLANMSHEIRTPMNAILGMTHLLGRTGVTAKQREYLDQAEESANQLLGLINDILDFTKLDSDKVGLEVSEFSLRKLMRQVHDHTRAEMHAKSLRLYTNIDDRIPDALIGDASRIGKILHNLADNAVKFTPPGGKLYIRVRQQMLMPGQTRLRFDVEDTGIGMSEEQVERLFLPFYQGDTSSTRRYGGTGLGLAVARKLVEMMEGEITCTSRVGAGALFSFTITLPIAGEVAAAFRDMAEESSGDRKLTAKTRQAVDEEDALFGMRVLLAEDNEINQMIAEELLSARGVSVSIVSTGREALEALGEGDYDLVLMDIQMPEMDGLTAAAHIRANPEYADLPVIAMTAHAMSGDKEISLRSGMNDHITKPIDPEILYATLRRWYKRAG